MEHEDDLIRADPRRRHPVRAFALIGVGAVLVAGGIVLGPVPIVPGFPLVILGLALIGLGSERARRLINRSERALPGRLRRTLRAARDALLRRDGGSSPPNPPPDSSR